MKNPPVSAFITISESYTNSNLPGRDFLTLGGKPMYRIMVDKLLSVNQIDRIVILSDSDRIITEFAGNSRIQVISCPVDFSEDPNVRMSQELPTSDLMVEQALSKVNGEHFIQVQCINPFLTIETLEGAIERYYQYVLDNEAYFDSVMSLSRVDKRLYNANNYPVIELRSDPWYVIFEDTIIQVFNRTAFRKNGNRKFGKNPMFLETREIENLAIETIENYQLAELIHENAKRFPFIYQG